MSTPAPATDQITATEAQMAQAQQAIVGMPVNVHRTVEFRGEKFRMADKISHIVLLRFANAADQDTDTDDIAAMSAMYELLKDCIYAGDPACGTCAACKAPNAVPSECPSFREGDWKRFERLAIRTKADTEELMPVVNQVIEVLMARPTEPASASSGGPPATSGNSTATSSAAPGGVSSS